jgi:hypothetical protein
MPCSINAFNFISQSVSFEERPRGARTGRTERIACAESQGDVIGELASNEGIFVDGKTFKIAKGKAKGEPSAQIAKLGAKEVGPCAIIFRYREKLYMVEGTASVANVQTMKSFQDDWKASYMNSVKDFQDNWDTSCMK